MSEEEDRAVDARVKALSSAFDKWPIITSCTLLAVLSFGVLAYGVHKHFQFLAQLSCSV